VKSTSLFKSLALAVGILAAGTAAANPITLGTQVEISDSSPYGPSNLNKPSTVITVNGVNKTVRAGLFDLNATTVPGGSYVRLLAFCLQPDVQLSPYDNPYTAVDLDGAGVALDPLGISKLWAEYRDDVVSGVTAAAFQLAVWELAYDGDTDLTDGDFRAAGAAGSAAATAQGWLSSLANLTKEAPNLFVLQDNQGGYDRQDLLIQTPIPGTLGLVGLGLLGLGALRRKVKE
jgi:hypothetical protein